MKTKLVSCFIWKKSFEKFLSYNKYLKIFLVFCFENLDEVTTIALKKKVFMSTQIVFKYTVGFVSNKLN